MKSGGHPNPSASARGSVTRERTDESCKKYSKSPRAAGREVAA